jgi:hypothetical protein
MFGRVLIPGAVYRELLQLSEHGYPIAETLLTDWIEIREIAGATQPPLHALLGAGETEAILLAESVEADWLVLDEKEGRAVAEQRGLSVIGLVGILLKAKQIGQVASVKEWLDLLVVKAGFWVSPAFYRKALELAGEK